MLSFSNWISKKRLSRLQRAAAKRATRGSLRTSLMAERLEERAMFALVNYLTNEHVDLNIGYSSPNSWTLGPRDSDNVIQYANDTVVLYVGSPALKPRPAGSEFDFLGAPNGSNIYILPQTQDPDVLYVGVASYGVNPSDVDAYNPSVESKGRVSGSQKWVKTTLVGLNHTNPDGTAGTGQFSVWQSDATPKPLMSSYNDGISNPNAQGLDVTDGISADDAVWILADGHTHYNFAFTAVGRYEVDFRMSINSGGVGRVSDPIRLYFSVVSVGDVQFDAASYSVNEGAGDASVDVVRVGGSDGRITVDYATANGSAISGTDYTSRNGTIEFLDGERRKTIIVPIINDVIEEPTESFSVGLSAAKPANLNTYVTEKESDANGLLGSIVTTTVSIIDNDQNIPPTISDVSNQSTNEDTPTSAIAFTIGDNQTPASALTVTASSSSPSLLPNANIVVSGTGANRTLVATPAANQFGQSVITLTVTDPGGLSATDTFTLTVNSVNDVPTISTINDVVMNEDGDVTVNFVVDDVETTAAVLTVTGTRTNTTLFPSIGTSDSSRLRIGGSGANRTLRIRPSEDLFGESNVTLSVSDPDSGTSSRTFKITVNSVYDPPIVRADNLLGIPNKTSTFELLRNDATSAEPGQTIQLQGIVSPPANGTVVMGSVPGTVRYTPNSGFTGSDQFTYSVVDNTGGSVNGIAYVNVADRRNVDGVHADIRLDYDDSLWSMETHSDLPFGFPNSGGSQNPTIQDYDETVFFASPSSVFPLPANLDPIQYSFLGAAPGSNIWLLPQSQLPGVTWPGISTDEIPAGVFASYTPSGDPRVTANAEWIRYELVGFRIPANSQFSMYQNDIAGPKVFWDSIDGANDTEGLTHGNNVSDTFWIRTNTHAHMNWAFTHAGRYELDVRARAFVNSPTGLVEVVSPTNTLFFDVNTFQALAPKESTPIVKDDIATALLNGPAIVIPVLNNDASSPDRVEQLTITSVVSGSGATLQIINDGTAVRYLPVTGFLGLDSFTYTVTDEHGGTSTATVNVTLTSNPPRASDDMFLAQSGQALRGNVTWNDKIDAPSNSGASNNVTALVTTAPTKGQVVLNVDGRFVYTPGPNFSGTDSFVYSLSNPQGGTSSATVTISQSTLPDFTAKLSTGEVDIGIAYEQGEWDLHLHDEVADIEYAPNEALLTIGKEGLVSRTGVYANSAYDFLGVPNGVSFFVLPETEKPNLLYLGVGAEELADDLFKDNMVSFRLASVTGPGHFSMWQDGNTPTTPIVKMASVDGIDADDAFSVAAGSHQHVNFAFSRAGTYLVSFFVDAFDHLLTEVEKDSEMVTYYFQVREPSLVPFALPKTAGAGQLNGVSSVSSTDFDGDGKLDLLAGAYGAGTVVWYRGLGDGSFENARTIDTSTPETWFTKAGDLDMDGDMDVLVGMYSGTLAWYQNNGSGVFAKNILATDVIGPWLTIGDLDGDGRNDIIATPDGGTEAYLFRGLATGGFATRTTLLSGFTKLGGVFLEDINADGLNDVFVGDYGADSLYWYINQANGVLGGQRSVATGDGGSISEIVDLDHDGVKDLLVLEYNSGQISWNRGLGSNDFGPRVVIPSLFDGPYAIVSSDFDLDGDRDIAVATYSNTATLAWLPNQGDGTFASQLLISTSTGQTSMLNAADFDRDGDNDLVVGSFSAGAVQFIENKLEEFATEILQPAAGTYLLGQHLDFQVHIGYPIIVTEVPSIGIQVGNRAVVANYLSGSGTPTLTFRYTVVQQDIDSDGVQLSGNSINLNGGKLIDPLSGDAPTNLPSATIVGVFVNGDAPFVKSIERLDPQVTNAPVVRFEIRFNEPVASVDATDLTLVTHDDISGAAIRSVSGNGSVWIVEVATGSGSGTIGIHVKPNATILDIGGQSLGAGYAGGQVYTLRRSATRVIDDYYTSGHGDLGPKMEAGHLELGVDPDGFEFENDEVLIYGNADALTPRPSGAEFDFIGVGAGENFYYWANNGTVASLPELGISGEGISGGTFARVTVTDPRVNNTAAFFKFQMIDVRSSNGGHVSVFNLGLGDPVVWMASSDGLTASDAMWLQEGSHQHFDFGFSKSGVYEVDFVTSGFRDVNGNGFYDEGIDPYIESGVETIYFGIDLAGGAQPYTIPAAMDGRAPIVGDDPVQIVSGSGVKGNVLANDRDPQNDPMETLLHTAPLHGDLVLNVDGSFAYTPNVGFGGSDSFRYWVRDDRGGYAIGTVSIEASGPLTGSLLSNGEVDLGVAYEEGSWDLHLHDEGNDIEYGPSEAVIDVNALSSVTRTGPFANGAFDFLGVANGSTFYVLPQTENTDLVYLGFGAEELAESLFIGDEVRLRLASVSGPGHFSIWLDGATSTTPSLVMASSDGIGDTDEYVVGAGSHAHVNFAFTQPGTYKIAFVATGVLASDGSSTMSELVTYSFRVESTPLADHEILIAPGSAARAGRPLQMEFQIVGLPTSGSNRYTYRIDLDGDGTTDRVVQNASNPMTLSDIVYSSGGSRIIHVTAEDALGVIAEGWQTMYISPAPAGDAANWMTSLDIDRDGQINALDVLSVVNHINQFGAGNASQYRFLLDVDRGGDVGPLDVLMLVNNINSGSGTELQPFESLVMSNTGTVDGFTHSLAIAGKIRGTSRQLWLSHNNEAKKNASQFVQPDGTFQLTDAAIVDLFGDLDDGGHLFTAAIRNDGGFSMTMDRYVIKDSELPNEFEIQSLLQTNSMLEVKWSSAGNDVIYNVWSKKLGEVESIVRSQFSFQSVGVALSAGEYDIWIEAIDGASNKRRTATTRISIR